ncbi:telomere-binding protein [Acrasis kona]|uniref:Telomere-binding protein n=1 Tax=Acrasis kona TaxID=1008807 RepID=A0AAW2Z135_9EUKA
MITTHTLDYDLFLNLEFPDGEVLLNDMGISNNNPAGTNGNEKKRKRDDDTDNTEQEPSAKLTKFLFDESQYTYPSNYYPNEITDICLVSLLDVQTNVENNEVQENKVDMQESRDDAKKNRYLVCMGNKRNRPKKNTVAKHHPEDKYMMKFALK